MSKKRRLIEAQAAQIREFEERFSDERDRRYMEIAHERNRALELSRSEQLRLDSKTASLLEHILEQLGHCTTHDDFEAFRREREQTLKPLMEFVAAERGRSNGSDSMRNLFFAVGGLLVGGATVVLMWLALNYKH